MTSSSEGTPATRARLCQHDYHGLTVGTQAGADTSDADIPQYFQCVGVCDFHSPGNTRAF
jgi:hypothetical protein